MIGANGCGIDDAVKLSAVTTRDNGRIAIAPPATLRCSTAEAIAHWLRDDVAPIAATLGAPLAASRISPRMNAAGATASSAR